MKFQSNKKNNKGASLDITPMVDIIFQLLIFFLLTAAYVKNPSIDIQLPKASVEQTELPKKEIVVSLTQEGKILVEGNNVDINSLGQKMKNLYSKNPDMLVLIQADSRTQHGKVVEVMDVAKQTGFERIGIAIERKNQQSPANH